LWLIVSDSLWTLHGSRFKADFDRSVMLSEVALEVICKMLRFVMKELWPVSFEGLYRSMVLFSHALACLYLL
jgi:hypothetical protein